MGYTTNQIYNRLYEKINDVHETFKGFFGEKYVDLQTKNEIQFKHRIERFLETCSVTDIDYETNDFDRIHEEVTDEIVRETEKSFETEKATIYVWWPNVTVTNEYDKSINIQDLYAKVEIQLNGQIPYENVGFQLNRATYPMKQFLSNFLHSHIKGIPKCNFSQFLSPCLGHGPIKETIATLKNEYDEITWMLFCQELSMYVTVESIAGGPWKRMETVGGRQKLNDYTDYNFTVSNITAFIHQFTIDDLKRFIKYYLEHGHLSISYRNKKFVCGMPYYEYIIDISNAFIEYYNAHLSKTKQRLDDSFHNCLLNTAILSNGIFYQNNTSNTPHDLDRYRNKFVLKFKGKDIHTTIIDDQDNSGDSYVTIVSQHLAMYVLKNILRTINFRYKNEYNNKERGDEGSSSTSQRVFYL